MCSRPSHSARNQCGTAGRRSCARSRAGARCAPRRRRRPGGCSVVVGPRVAAPARARCRRRRRRATGSTSRGRSRASRRSIGGALLLRRDRAPHEGNRVAGRLASRRSRQLARTAPGDLPAADPTNRSAMPTRRATIQSDRWRPTARAGRRRARARQHGAGDEDDERGARPWRRRGSVTSPAPIRTPSSTNTTAFSGWSAATIHSTWRARSWTAGSSVNSGTSHGPRRARGGRRRRRRRRRPTRSCGGRRRAPPPASSGAEEAADHRLAGDGDRVERQAEEPGTPGTRSGGRRRRRRRCGPRRRSRRGSASSSEPVRTHELAADDRRRPDAGRVRPHRRALDAACCGR